MTEIDAERKELEDKIQEFRNKPKIGMIESLEGLKYHWTLDGFNLGVSLAQKEFLDFLRLLNMTESNNKIGELIDMKISILKQSLGEKGK